MTLTSRTQKVLDSTYLIVPVGLMVGLGFWVYQMIRRNKEQV